MRLDLDVDGIENAVEEVWTESTAAGPGQPATATPSGRCAGGCETELEARRRHRPARRPAGGRSSTRASATGWASRSATGSCPGENARAVRPAGRAGVASARASSPSHLWVTPYEPGERYAAGDYPNQHPGGAGLPEWTAADRPVADRDIVVWYTFGHHHVPRPEDWPVMPVATIGFLLKPVGFFERNPALDVPPSRAARRALSERGRAMSGVEGRVALVTGASSGIGAATARAAGRGRRAASRSPRAAATTSASRARWRSRATCATRPRSKRWSRPASSGSAGSTSWSSNAGVGAYGDFLDLNPEWLDEMIDTNVKGFLHTIRAGLPRLLESASADLVAVTSIAGQRAPEGEAVYAASEARPDRLHALARPRAVRQRACAARSWRRAASRPSLRWAAGRTPEDPDLPGMLRAEEVADAVMYAVTRPRTRRIFEASILPMATTRWADERNHRGHEGHDHRRRQLELRAAAAAAADPVRGAGRLDGDADGHRRAPART